MSSTQNATGATCNIQDTTRCNGSSQYNLSMSTFCPSLNLSTSFLHIFTKRHYTLLSYLLLYGSCLCSRFLFLLTLFWLVRIRSLDHSLDVSRHCSRVCCLLQTFLLSLSQAGPHLLRNGAQTFH